MSLDLSALDSGAASPFAKLEAAEWGVGQILDE